MAPLQNLSFLLRTIETHRTFRFHSQLLAGLLVVELFQELEIMF